MTFRIRESGIGIRLFGLVLALVGYLGPWVGHKTAALTVTGFELAEFAKFFPQVQAGTIPITRVLFYVPLVVIFIMLVLFASRSAVLPVRLVVPPCAAALLLIVLLPYSVVNGVRQALAMRSPFILDPQDVGQLTLVVVGMVLVLLSPLAYRLRFRFSWRTQAVLVAFLSLVGAIPALWQFSLLQPLVVALYGESISPGWGLIACAAGFALLLFSGIFAAVDPERSVQSLS
jgi:hypothetical protein